MNDFDPCRSPLPLMGWGQGWLVANKPSGMSIHNDPGSDLCSLLNQYLQSQRTASKALGCDPQYGLHPVHRLDRETSGLVMLSCRRDVFDQLSRQFAGGAVDKRYLALIHGLIQAEQGWHLWRRPLTPKAAGRRNPQGGGRRTPCKTQYRLIRQSRRYSLIECRPLTGKTHQIRRHAALAGHPLVGDRRYGSKRACNYLEKNHQFRRLGLHAVGLTIQVPHEHAPRTFATPKLPDDIERLIAEDEKTPYPSDR